MSRDEWAEKKVPVRRKITAGGKDNGEENTFKSNKS